MLFLSFEKISPGGPTLFEIMRHFTLGCHITQRTGSNISFSLYVLNNIEVLQLQTTAVVSRDGEGGTSS